MTREQREQLQRLANRLKEQTERLERLATKEELEELRVERLHKLNERLAQWLKAPLN